MTQKSAARCENCKRPIKQSPIDVTIRDSESTSSNGLHAAFCSLPCFAVWANILAGDIMLWDFDAETVDFWERHSPVFDDGADLRATLRGL
jgi:hypothetical protein